MRAMRDADIGFRMITGGCFLRHDVIRYFDYDTVGADRQRQHRARSAGSSWATIRVT